MLQYIHTNPQVLSPLSLSHCPPIHPFSALTQNVSIIPFRETDADNWSQIFVLAGHKETSYSPPCSCLLSILPSSLSGSSNGFPTSTTTRHSSFHWHDKAVRMHDPDPKPPSLPSLCIKVALTSITSCWFSLMSFVALIKKALALINALAF